MRITQGTFSYLPDFTDEEISAQISYALCNNWPVSVEFTDDPHPRNVYWEMWGLPMFDLKNPPAYFWRSTPAAPPTRTPTSGSMSTTRGLAAKPQRCRSSCNDLVKSPGFGSTAPKGRAVASPTPPSPMPPNSQSGTVTVHHDQAEY